MVELNRLQTKQKHIAKKVPPIHRTRAGLLCRLTVAVADTQIYIHTYKIGAVGI